MADRGIEIGDAIVTRIESVLTDPDEATVARVYSFKAFADAQRLSALTGRRVLVFLDPYRQAEIADRSADVTEYRYAVLVVERCDTLSADGEVPTAWVDDRVEFARRLRDSLGDARGTPVDGQTWSQSAEADELYDAELLTAYDVFWCEISVAVREIDPPDDE